ncbi:PLP-dependent aminotransferase family protein [Heyndrickxia ginsengihumi]|uniref:PLP-dependent aminotransferase family protein n=2 Tax=Heyndrickxia ginsengihumi TaxID=363870 RepID=A0A6M0PAZ6_9BACI|nr:PLP-dependent aminotransferase family protein [Heyndrickxia ginsengihumi]MBE6185139.1 PLP-dependent aminotransferase family protein [Bacillus sp. (in: firmicutes)]MCM3025048.1 PLP-dependent aminotransferase family protein [Heyndrickxia ginsengihumi]NEY20468.1 PLP-dependent aminotransferase family protein [Heyndrickxia ginsengihumi]
MEPILSHLSFQIKENAIDSFMDEIKTPVTDPVFFSVGLPNKKLIPKKQLQAMTNMLFENDPSNLYNYCSSKGYDPFISTISAKETIAENFIMVTNGNTQGFDLVCRMLLNQKDSFAMEAYTYSIAHSAIHQYNLNAIEIPLQQDGMDMDVLEASIKKVPIKALYIIPNAQNPTGITISLEKRKRLIDLAYQYNFIIIEDDPYRELLFDERIPSLFELDPLKEKVIYLYSFSKIIAPAMRTGFILAHPVYIQKLEQFKQIQDACTSPINQMIINNLISSYVWPDLLEQQKNFYENRKKITQHFLINMHKKYGWLSSDPAGGLFYWVNVLDGDVLEWMKYAAASGVIFVPGKAFSLNDVTNTKIRICYAYCNDDEMMKGFERLEESFVKWKNNVQ